MRRYSKFHNVKTEVDGIIFHSKSEADYYVELKGRVERGEITDLVLQPVFNLKVNGQLVCKYIGDFSWTENGQTIVCDVKSERTRKEPTYRIKNKLMKAVHGIEIMEVIPNGRKAKKETGTTGRKRTVR